MSDALPEPAPWHKGAAPRYIALFLLIVFCDQLAASTLALGGLLPSIAGAAVAGLLAFFLLYLPLASWGHARQTGIAPLAEFAFGQSGARWFVAPVVALVHIAWFAVVIAYASLLTLRALQSLDLVSIAALTPSQVAGVTLPGNLLWVYIIVVWGLAAAVLGPLLERIVAAIMYAYNLVPALILGVLMVLMLGGIATSPITLSFSGRGPWLAFGQMFQLVLAYATLAALGAAEWGAASRRKSDVRLAGLVGIGLAPAVIISVALVSIVGALGLPDLASDAAATAMVAADPVRAEQPWADPLNYHQAVLVRQTHGAVAWVLLMALALPLLGPACHAPARYREAIQTLAPGLPPMMSSLIGAALAMLLMIPGWALDLPRMFVALGALTAPLAAVAAATALRYRSRTSSDTHTAAGPLGIRLPAVVAWTIGVLIGLAPLVPGASRVFKDSGLAWPTILLGYTVAFVLAFLIPRAESDVKPATRPEA